MNDDLLIASPFCTGRVVARQRVSCTAGSERAHDLELLPQSVDGLLGHGMERDAPELLNLLLNVAHRHDFVPETPDLGGESAAEVLPQDPECREQPVGRVLAAWPYSECQLRSRHRRRAAVLTFPQ